MNRYEIKTSKFDILDINLNLDATESVLQFTIGYLHVNILHIKPHFNGLQYSEIMNI